MRSLAIIGSVGIVKAAVDIPDQPNGVDFNMTEAEWAENQAEFQRNLEEYEQSNYETPFEVTRGGMTTCDQQCSEWCWATSATMTSSAFTSISKSECVSYEAMAASMKTGAQCDSSCSNRCDKPGQPQDMIQAIQQFSGASYTSGNTLSQQKLDSALQAGPVILLIHWNNGGGHAITCSGVKNGKYQVHNPEGSDESLSYGQIMKYKNRGTWGATVYSRGGPSPGPSPHPSPGPSPGGCQDQPSSWRSSEGDSCSTYEQAAYCTPRGQPGQGWRRQWGSITDYADRRSGRSAFDACCACGGGSSGQSVLV